MKKILICLIFTSILAPQCFAASGLKTYTPSKPSYTAGHHKHYKPRNRKYKKHNRHNCPYHNNDYYNGYRNYNSYYPNNYYYNYPYTSSNNSFFGSIKDFFGGGQMTGYTPSFDPDFDNSQYGYHNGFYDPNGDFYGANYGFKSGASVKILD